MAGAITETPVGIGAKCVSAAEWNAIAGKTIEKNIDTGYYWYDKTNINNPEIQAVLYPAAAARSGRSGRRPGGCPHRGQPRSPLCTKPNPVQTGIPSAPSATWPGQPACPR